VGAPQPGLLIVRHGPGRGRLPGYLAPALKRLAELDPAKLVGVRFHETGSSAAPDLSDVAAVFFWLADPLREMYPDCFAEAAEIEARARAAGLRLVNPPSSLSNSIKSVQARLWIDAGIPTPPCVPVENREQLEAAANGTGFPVLLKSDRLHAQERMVFCASAAALRAYPDVSLPLPGVVSPFIDTRAGWADRRPGTPWAAAHHKKRLIVFGDVLQARNVFFSDGPIVGLSTSSIWRFRPRDGRPSRPGLFGLRRRERAELAIDLAYFRTGECDAPDVMRRAARVLGFGFAAIDYSVFADGRVCLWEANPYHYVPGPRSYVLPEQRHFQERYDAFCRALGALFTRLQTRATTNSA
jgi:hypothetical protein